MAQDELTFRVKWKGPDSLHSSRIKARSEAHAAWKIALDEMSRGFWDIELIEVTLEGFLPDGHPGQPSGFGYMSGPCPAADKWPDRGAADNAP